MIVISKDTAEMSFSRKRQRFLVNQGYAYKVVTKLAGSEADKELLYETREQQVTLLHQTLAANDADLEEENPAGAGKGTVRKAGNMASMSGADDNVYMELKNKTKHPLFKKLRALTAK